jgi:hypothetical protein
MPKINSSKISLFWNGSDSQEHHAHQMPPLATLNLTAFAIYLTAELVGITWKDAIEFAGTGLRFATI